VAAVFLDYELMVESSLVAISTACVSISVYLPANKAKPGHMVFSSAAQPIGRGVGSLDDQRERIVDCGSGKKQTRKVKFCFSGNGCLLVQISRDITVVSGLTDCGKGDHHDQQARKRFLSRFVFEEWIEVVKQRNLSVTESHERKQLFALSDHRLQRRG
jgi:hypothetical protein